MLRLRIVKAGFLLAFLAIAARLIQIQVIESPMYKEIALKQYEAKVVLPAARGSIYDRNGNVLASNSMYVSFAADPWVADDHAWAIASRFSRVFGKPAKYYIEKLRSAKRFVWLERQVRPEVAKKVRSETLRGVVELQEPKRLYHYPDIGGALIGFTDVDNAGLSGVELQFEPTLHGTDGYVVMQRDGRGQARPSVDYLRVEPLNGSDVFLTIDLVYQSIAEEKLKKGIETSRADGGMLLMMEPSTGELLAAAQYPSVDPSSPGRASVVDQKLRAVTDVFEPGSVFKIVTAAAALEDRLVSPNQRFNAEHGTYTVKLPDGKLRSITDTHEHDILTFQEAMEVSSNIVMAKVSDLIGAERLYMTARAFGFGNETGIEYPGEAKGDLKRPTQWSGTTLNTLAYGYEVGVTPLQIALAYCAVANNGLLMKPTLVRRIVDESGTVLDEHQPEAVRRPLTEKTASLLRRFFEGVVERGTAPAARVEGVRVAGKTGTSRKFAGGRYETGSYIASFVGFLPADRPELVCLVMLDNPRSGGYTGGASAAPIFKEIVRQIIATGKALVPGPNRTYPAQEDQAAVIVPDVRSLQEAVARKLLTGRGLGVEVYGAGVVVRQVPAAGTRIPKRSRVTLVLDGAMKQASGNQVAVPDVRGLSVRRAVNRLAIEQLQAKVQGSGVVTHQSPSVGHVVPAGTSIVLVCEPQSLAAKNN